MLTKANVVESAAYLKEKLPFVPEIALVLGSGIGPLADEVENPVYVPYGGFRISRYPPRLTTQDAWCAAHWPDAALSVCRAVCTATRATRRTR